jgi:TetR/AcrR family transcriptional repressor of nem operon
MRYKSTQKEETRDRILAQASKAVRVQGIGGISVAGLMAEAGLTHGGFYAHFPSRDALVAAALDRAFADSPLLTRLAEAPDPTTGLTRVIDAYLSEGALRHPERACAVPTLAGEIPHSSPAIRERYDAGYDRLRKAITDALVSLGRAEPDALASSAFAEMVGSMVLARTRPNDEALALLENARGSIKKRLGLVS